MLQHFGGEGLRAIGDGEAGELFDDVHGIERCHECLCGWSSAGEAVRVNFNSRFPKHRSHDLDRVQRLMELLWNRHTLIELNKVPVPERSFASHRLAPASSGIFFGFGLHSFATLEFHQ